MSRINSIVKKKIINEKLYNLAVKDDESYIANGIVVHNCRSLLVPIFIDDDFDGKFDIPAVKKTQGNFVELA